MKILLFIWVAAMNGVAPAGVQEDFEARCRELSKTAVVHIFHANPRRYTLSLRGGVLDERYLGWDLFCVEHTK